MKQIINISEHEKVENNFDSNILSKFDSCFKSEKDNDKATYLGLHQELEENNQLLKSHYFIGYRWIDEEQGTFAHVSPKLHREYEISYQADFMKMFQYCLNDPIVSRNLDDTYSIFFDEKWIEINEKEDNITPFLILHFLKVVKKICQNGLKKGYIKKTENLTSKVKGRILLTQTFKKNHFKNRFDKTICCYQAYTINCLENKIIKTALGQCGKLLESLETDEISKLLKQNIRSFELVEETNISDSDFSKIRSSAFYKEYQQALRLAKMIFKRFGFSLNGGAEEEKYKVPPFYINMPELFERYVEVRLREMYPELIDGNRNSCFTWRMRPDFLLPQKKMIIDAKYKYWFDSSSNIFFKADYQQLSLYGRENNIRELINLSDNETADIVFIYPDIKGNDNIDLDKKNPDGNFHKISSLRIKIPMK